MTTQRNASRHALELRSWITRVHETGAYRNRDDDFLEVLASWPITAEAASTLSHLLRSGLLTDTQYAQMTTQRALVRGRALPGYQGEYRRVRVLNGWLRHTHQPFQCGRQEARAGSTAPRITRCSAGRSTGGTPPPRPPACACTGQRTRTKTTSPTGCAAVS